MRTMIFPVAVATLAFVAVMPIAVAQTSTTTAPPASTNDSKAPPVAGMEPGFTGLSGATDPSGNDTSTGTGKTKQTATGGNPGGPAGRN